MAQYTAPEEIKSESHIALWIYAFDFFFIIIFIFISYSLRGMVAKPFRIPYILFSCICAIFLTVPSPFNHKRRMLHSLMIYLHKDNAVYHPLTGKEKW